MADNASKATPKKALADPIRRPSGPREALDGAEKLQKWPQKSFKRPQKPSKKAAGEASSDHGGSRRWKEGLMVAKNRPRKPAGGQDFSKTPFWCHIGFFFVFIFCTFLVPTSGPNSVPFLVSVFAPFRSQKVAQTDPGNLQHSTLRPEKAPR